MESKNYLRKLERKQRRIRAKLSEELDIKFVDEPTMNLAVCNAGLANGLSAEYLSKECPNDGLKHITMPEGKSYCFLEFENLKSAMSAFNSLYNADNDKSFLLSYVDKIFSSIWDVPLPDGLRVYKDFISFEEEISLIACLHWNEQTTGALKQRQVQHFGYEFRYDNNNVDKDSPLPDGIPKECDFLTDRLYKLSGFHFEPDQLTVNKYQPGQGLPPHVDTHSAFEDPILSLSLNSDVVMDFRHRSGVHSTVLLPRRSLLIMSDAARYDWSHGITARVQDAFPNGTIQLRGERISFTFRRILRTGECRCSYTAECDTQRKESTSVVNSADLENEHVHRVYEEIATHFSDTRHRPWPRVRAFVENQKCGSVLVDVGCGNGKYLGINKTTFNIGCDHSGALLEVCVQRGYETFICNCLHVPLKDNIADACISIAVIHHLSTEKRRLQAIAEMIRVLRPNGKALIYVWARDQSYDNELSIYLKSDGNSRDITPSTTSLVSLPVHTNRTQFKEQDVLVPWKLRGSEKRTFLRYYHVFEQGELETLCCQINDVKILDSYYDQGNWCVLLEKNK